MIRARPAGARVRHSVGDQPAAPAPQGAESDAESAIAPSAVERSATGAGTIGSRGLDPFHWGFPEGDP